MAQPEITYRIHPEIAARELKGQLLFLLADRRLYTTNETGQFIWRQLIRKSPETKIVGEFQKHFSVSAEIARRDVRRFLAELEKKSVIVKAAGR